MREDSTRRIGTRVNCRFSYPKRDDMGILNADLYPPPQKAHNNVNNLSTSIVKALMRSAETLSACLNFDSSLLSELNSNFFVLNKKRAIWHSCGLGTTSRVEKSQLSTIYPQSQTKRRGGRWF